MKRRYMNILSNQEKLSGNPEKPRQLLKSDITVFFLTFKNQPWKSLFEGKYSGKEAILAKHGSYTTLMHHLIFFDEKQR